MEAFTRLTGLAALLNRNNIDTDQIIAKQFLKKTEKTGYGQYLFFDWRYLADGSENPEFELNQKTFRGSSILVTGDNFGCGSSREHAPWALADYGFRAIIATSYADIFFNNCFKNGILPVLLQAEQRDQLAAEITKNPGVNLTVDLEKQEVTSPGGLKFSFEIDNFRKQKLLKGLDDIDFSLTLMDKIKAFENKQAKELPWLWKTT
ncbi:MAG: 3-isopropylmalate dehydratase small subunit [Candidatus Lambdaproteobacteria bacterium RIFOXYD1_FULL_56_27]|uniref:3-isopropylmalate dehydratase small subunit n=1 Tax=Candidatus Lambdaproteobacteria bacterium RIFOXYD2_FULL_56_26 TaxID=1817773 RepID=A0A1F6GRA7_9PROT|nr:MAG: 3-isopropylmalate dehydratase small subunit [Candidatus Lambdaproteobacteria bacterium RIFOXYC1_FULL_56_13]OGH00665.1 MAG: 3-isopropylmalate dehydratase small subunit [Candidatus Lambdaproteobacteria bacterium RIFOXYD2_FULL_56_26]OGH07832.1 MAG: 3-isopropylmalate dehydratase small subunit [Candidatus Lambdaproteobacteria bacterium RIFOXYD1_FULL_56_27]